MSRDVFIFVNGILTRPGNAFAWTDRAVHWFNRNEEHARCYAFEYGCPALLRFAFQAGFARDLAETLAQYDPTDRLHLVGHSNGCDVIARAIRLTSAPIASVHLISAALNRDFSATGLAERLRRGQIRTVYCLCSRGDQVLRYLAPASRIATLGLAGYGDLGCKGPLVPADVGDRVRTLWRNTLGHGDWFSAEEFERTMETVRLQGFSD